MTNNGHHFESVNMDLLYDSPFYLSSKRSSHELCVYSMFNVFAKFAGFLAMMTKSLAIIATVIN